MFRQTTDDKQKPQHKLGNWTNRWSKVQADARCPSRKKQFKQQQQHCWLEDDLIFNLRTSRESRLIQFVYTVTNIPKRLCKTASNFEKRNFKSWLTVIVFTFSRICRTRLFHVVVLWPFVTNGEEMNTYTAIIPVAVVVKLCLILKLPKIDETAK